MRLHPIALPTLLSLVLFPWECSAQDVLMFGNSYTQQNNLRALLRDLLQTQDATTSVDGVLSGGKTIGWHADGVANAGSTHSTKLANMAAGDVLFLQDQSQVPSCTCFGSYDASFDGALAIRNAMPSNTDMIFYMTWGRKTSDNNSFNNCFSEMQDNLRQGYEAYRDEALTSGAGDVYIAPVGYAFKMLHDQELCTTVPSAATCQGSGNTGLTEGCNSVQGSYFESLYTGDGSHPTPRGSYLTACVMFATMTGISPVGLAGPSSMDAADIAKLQGVAKSVVLDDSENLGYSYSWSGAVDPTSAPVDPTSAPVDPTSAPVDPTSAPVLPTSAPVLPTSAPVDPTSAPVDPTSAPVIPTSAPVDPTSAPVDPTSAPVDPTSAPVLPTSAPVLPTSAPVEPTSAPVDPTSAPVDPTSAPVDPTSAPVDPTSAPVDPTSAPVLPTSAPVLPTSAPVLPTSAPVLPTSAPVLPTSAPVIPTSAPVIPTSAPVLPTSAPVLPTSAPVLPTSTTAPVNNDWETCDDDETAKISHNNKLKTCDWLRYKSQKVIKRKCGNDTVASLCPETCGFCSDSCVDDTSAVFDVNNRVTGKTCKWVAKKAARKGLYCTAGNDAFYHCRETCESCHESYDSFPSAAPSAELPDPLDDGICEDDDTVPFFWGNVAKTCKWLRRQANRPNRKQIVCVPENDAYWACEATCDRCGA